MYTSQSSRPPLGILASHNVKKHTNDLMFLNPCTRSTPAYWELQARVLGNAMEANEHVTKDVENTTENVENVIENVKDATENAENVSENVENVSENVENVSEDIEGATK